MTNSSPDKLSPNTDERVLMCSLPAFADQNARKAEQRVVNFLVAGLVDRQLNGEYRLLVNYSFPANKGPMRDFEIDIVLISRVGLFLIEVKNWKDVKAYDGEWVRNGLPQPNPLTTIQQRARILSTQLYDSQKGLLRHTTQPGIAGIVVLANRYVVFEDHRNRQHQEDHKVLIQKLTPDLINALQSDQIMRKSSKLENAEIHHIHRELFRRHEPDEPMVRHYKLVERLEGGLNYEAFKARHMQLTDSPPLRIKRYIIQDNERSPDSLQQFRRSAQAGANMLAHQNILSTKEFFQDDNRDDLYYEVTEWPVGKWLREIMNERTEPLPIGEQLDIVEALCDGLDHAHNVETEAVTGGILHRNLGPNSIFLANRRQGKPIIKLADFDYAKLAHKDTFTHATVAQGGLLAQNQCSAPEVIHDPRLATPGSDLFSLGALWFLLASLPQKVTGTPRPEQVQTLSGLPDEAKTLMKRMLDSKPEDGERPKSAQEVKEQLGAIRKKIADV